MKRSYDRLLPFEERILAVLGEREMYGLEIAEALELERSHGLSTLYRALRRLADPSKLGQLTSRLEPARTAERSRRPRRRLYQRRPAQRSGGEQGAGTGEAK